MSRPSSSRDSRDRLADLLESTWTTPAGHDMNEPVMNELVVLAELLRRRPTVRPDPAFRSRLRDRLVSGAGAHGRWR